MIANIILTVLFTLAVINYFYISYLRVIGEASDSAI